MLSPTEEQEAHQGGTALWSITDGRLIAFNEAFAAFYDFAPAKLRDATDFRWPQLAQASFIHDDTKSTVENSVWRLQCAIDLISLGLHTDLYEPCVHLVSAAGRLKVGPHAS